MVVSCEERTIKGSTIMKSKSKAATPIIPDREKALDAALTQIERSFGKGAIMRLGDSTVLEVEVIPTESASFIRFFSL